MLGILKSGKFWIGVGCFAGGVFATSKVARKIAVKGMAAGIFGILTPQTTSILHNLSTMMLSGISTRPLFDDTDVPVLV